MDNKPENQPDYEIQEIVDEVLADDSWEPDIDKRRVALMSLGLIPFR